MRLAILFLMAGICGCNAVLGIVPGDERPEHPCHTVADCIPFVPECRQAIACVSYTCEYEDKAADTPISKQIDGDCLVAVCDGSGELKQLVVLTDIPEDNNPCTVGRCDQGTPHQDVKDLEIRCYSGPNETEGIGACKPGVWHCAPDGTPLECQGDVVPALEICDAQLQDEDCNGQTNESGTNCVCFSGDMSPCYSGPVDTLNVGLCHGGESSCAPSGLGYDVCQNEVTPVVETCDLMGRDEDCDGEINESGLNCSCGDGWFSQGEECDDDNLINADACSSMCKRTISSVALGGFHTCARLLDGSVKCWGRNAEGQLGLGDTAVRGDAPGEMGANLPAVSLGTLARAASVHAGSFHTCAWLVDGRLKCWGRNSFGQLGLGDVNPRGTMPGSMGDALPPVALGTGLIVQAMALGGHHGCALFQGGKVKCWGRNDTGQLGLGTTNHQGDAMNEMGDLLPFVDLGTGVQATAIAAGNAHTCVLLADGALKCWGYGGRGQLGLGTTDNRGDAPNEMGDMLPAIALGAGQKAVAITAAGDHTCVLLNDTQIRCWGANGAGELGLGDTMDRLDVAASSAIDLGVSVKVRGLASGAFHTCAQLADARIKCWGLGMTGQLGLEDMLSRGDDVNEMGDLLPALDFPGRVTTVVAGSFHGCVLLVDGTLRCWGDNANAQLGLGDILPRGDDANEMGANMPQVTPY